ncbi:uncharacterized protein PgNI_09272 [Pyricularia grisea]|uniref:Heterokaryon incompatibility domain-containing protein n=1 Tax=Pyricularia grisea TaxID=148305 RepID=A0A6P8ATS2_PYRGI|nr:uncharacterized protein PgNI_09272 [Pyricularia grisea]TLD05520.1 hypothetical protein PgNI_09272 [Pyricularia grisea]
MEALYEYEPLDLGPDAVRVCRLFPRTQDLQAPDVIRCEIFPVLLHEVKGMLYDALSYTWGCDGATNEFVKHPIVMNDKRHYVTTNLFNALRNIRLDDRERVVWIDALCINQADNDERSLQVAQMAKTYKYAVRVLIWLGPGDFETGAIIRWMDALDKAVRARPEFDEKQSLPILWKRVLQIQGYSVRNRLHLRYSSNKRHRLSISFEEALDVGGWEGYHMLPTLTESEQKAIPSLYRAAWFRRVWVIQEAANAQSACVMYGRYSVPSSTFALVPQLFNFEIPSGTKHVLDIMPGPLRQNSWWKDKRDLGTILNKFGQSCEASDERDRVYALLGIASDTASSKGLLPNYKADTSEVVRQTAAFLMADAEKNCNAELWMPHLPQWTMEEFLKVLPQPGSSVLQWTLQQELPEAIAFMAEPGETSDSMNESKWPGPSDSLDDRPCSLVWRVVASKPQYRKLLGVILLRPDIDPDIKHNKKTPLVQAAQLRNWQLFHRLLVHHRVKRWAMQEHSEFLWERPEPRALRDPKIMDLLSHTLRVFLLNLPGLARDGLLGATGKVDHPLYYASQELLSLQHNIDNLIENDLQSIIHILSRSIFTEATRFRFDLARQQSWPAYLKSSLVSDYIAAHLGLGFDLKDLWLYAEKECLLLLAVGLEDLPALSTLLGLKLSLDRYPLCPLLVVATVTRNVVIARMLLENGSNPNIPYDIVDRMVWPLQIAVMNRQMDMARLLLDHKADPNQESQGVLAPIEIAEAWEDDDMVNLLVERKVARKDNVRWDLPPPKKIGKKQPMIRALFDFLTGKAWK